MSKLTDSATIIPNHSDHRVSGIYALLNTVNGKYYVGQSQSLYNRYNRHSNCGKDNKIQGRAIVHAIRKYGFKSFEFKILELVESRRLTAREQYWMDLLGRDEETKSYNLCPAAGTTAGYKHSLETRIKVALAGRGRKHSDETKAKMSKFHTGKKLSAETKRKISEVKKGKKKGPVPGKSVIQLDKITLIPIATYQSISAASRATDIGISNIAETVKGKRKSAGGFKWEAN